MARVRISEFGIIQKLLAGATVAFYKSDDSGESTGDLATIYSASSGSTQTSNPQTLDTNGKLPVSCYVEEKIVAEISNISDLADRSIRKSRQNPLQFALGATNAAYEGAAVDGSVEEAQGYASDASDALDAINKVFSGAASTTSLTISTGSKAFTVAAGLPFGVGQFVIATSAADPTVDYMSGQITAYSGTTLTVDVTTAAGSGTHTDWNIMISGPRGATGATGPSGAGTGDVLAANAGSEYTAVASTFRSNIGLGDAAVQPASAFATAAQGALAENAIQTGNATKLTQSATQNTTSGTTVNFGSIPSGVKKIEINVAGISTNGTSDIELTIGDSGGIETTGYSGSVTEFSASGIATDSAPTDAFTVVRNPDIASTFSGKIELSLVDAATFTWALSGNIADDVARGQHLFSGKKSLSAELTQLQLQTASGTQTFDAGSVSIQYYKDA